MNVTQLNVIAEESCANIEAGQVVAFRRAGDHGWSDPWGGFFDDAEQHELDALARGDTSTVSLLDADGSERTFAARLAAKF